MGLFGKKVSTCPVCDLVLAKNENMGLHNLKHVIPSPDGGPGFGWQCGCGDADGVWDGKAGAAAGLTMHMQQRHGISAF